MLTEGLLRLEYSEDGIFEYRATQFAFYRDFPKTEYRLVKTEDGIEIHTSRIHLLVAPITAPRIAGINVAEVKVWLPEGIWHDIYTGMVNEGNRTLNMYRDLNSVPVLAKAGAIVQFTDEIKGSEAIKNPSSLCVKVYAGADGSFELYEDDNETCF